MDSMGEGLAIIPTAPEAIRNRDSHYPYRFDSYFYYLTGFKEPESVLVLLGGAQPKTILFCRDKDMEREIWDGFRYGADAAKEQFGFDEAYSINQLDAVVLKLLANQPKLYFSLGENAIWDGRVTGWLNSLRNQARTGVSVPDDVSDIRKLVDEMRLYKSPFEQEIMRQSANIAAAAHNRAIHFAKPNMMEYEVEAEFLHEFYRKGAQAPAYTSSVAGGANACTLHYNANNCVLKAGDLLLIDAGCELDGYASDITRTFPVNGKFTGPQRALYDITLASQEAAIAATKPGNAFMQPHEAALKVLTQGLLDEKLLKLSDLGSLDNAIETAAYRRFYMHRTSHWLGMDVHDVGSYREPLSTAIAASEKPWRLLKSGMVLTIEPGLYVRPANDIDEAFWNIGIRIEDDAVVNDLGCELISRGVPVKADEIEALMKNN